MSRNSPYFSVVLPTYNRAHLLQFTIDSILDQQFLDYEVLIIDDGSTDNTKEVVDKNYSQNKRIKYFWKANEERGRARNYGLDVSNGKYVVFFDSDDIMLSNYLSELFRAIESNKPDFVAMKYVMVDSEGVVVSKGNSDLLPGWKTYKDLLGGNSYACHFAIRKDNPLLIRFLDDRKFAVMEDWIFLIKNLFQNKLYLSDTICIHMVSHDNRSMANNQLVIKRRELAKNYLLKNMSLSQGDKRDLAGNSDLFCSIHAYLDNRRLQALKYLLDAVKNIGLKRQVLLHFFKVILGYTVVIKLRGLSSAI